MLNNNSIYGLSQLGRVIYDRKTSNVEEAIEKFVLLGNDLIIFMAKDGGYKYGIIVYAENLKRIGNGTMTDYFLQITSCFQFCF